MNIVATLSREAEVLNPSQMLTKFLQKDFALKVFLGALTTYAVTAIYATPEAVWVPGIAALMLIWIDGVTGVIAAGWEGKFRSKTVWLQGAFKLATYLSFAAPSWYLGYLIVKHLNMVVGWGLPLSWCTWVYVGELSSILENLRRLEKPVNGRKLKLGPFRVMLQKWDAIMAAAMSIATKPATVEESEEPH